jgi:hypothetical protein
MFMSLPDDLEHQAGAVLSVIHCCRDIAGVEIVTTSAATSIGRNTLRYILREQQAFYCAVI